MVRTLHENLLIFHHNLSDGSLIVAIDVVPSVVVSSYYIFGLFVHFVDLQDSVHPVTPLTFASLICNVPCQESGSMVLSDNVLNPDSFFDCCYVSAKSSVYTSCAVLA